MANCSTLEELQYEKHVERDGDDCGKRISRCRPNARRLGGRELRQVAACQQCKTVQDRLALGIPRDRAWTRYVLRLVTSGVRSVHQWRGLVDEGPMTTRAAALSTHWSGAMVDCGRPESTALQWSIRERTSADRIRSTCLLAPHYLNSQLRYLIACGYFSEKNICSHITW